VTCRDSNQLPSQFRADTLLLRLTASLLLVGLRIEPVARLSSLELTYALLQQLVRVWYGGGFIILGASRVIKPWGAPISKNKFMLRQIFFADVLIYYNN
jgi:hypothetical protein